MAPLLDWLPLLADRLAESDQLELRALFEVVQLDLTYVPVSTALDVDITL